MIDLGERIVAALEKAKMEFDCDAVRYGIELAAEIVEYQTTVNKSKCRELEAENAKLREALIAAEESLATYVGCFGYEEGSNLVLKQMRKALAETKV